jgi:hypothetical protein
MKANSIFFRGALAVAVSASCGYAAASTIALSVGTERVTAARVAQAVDGIGTLNTTAQDVRVTLDAAYSANGRVTLTLTNAQFRTTPSSATCLSVSDQSMSLVRESGGASGSTSVTYLVTGVSSGQNTVGDVCTFAGVDLLTASLPSTSGDAKIEFTAKNNLNNDIDNTNIGSATLASVMAQFAFVSDVDLNGVIDVQNDLLKFTENTDTGTNATVDLVSAYAVDSYSFRVNAISVSPANSAAQGTFQTVIAGDFSFVKDAGDVSCASANSITTAPGVIAMTAAGIAAGNYGLTIGSDCQSLTVKLLPGAFAGAVTGGTNVNAAVAFAKTGTSGTASSVAFAPVAAFTTSSTQFGYGALASGRAQSATIGSIGSWTTNGTTIDVPYMPFGQVSPAISHVITLNNRSGSAGAIRVSAWRAAGTYGGVTQTAVACGTQNFSVGTIDAATVKNITSEVTNYVQSTCGWGTGQTRVALRFDVATPAASTELYSSFTIDGTRSNVVVNSSNGRGSSTR